MRRPVIVVRSNSAADRILTFLKVPHVRTVIARNAEELLVKYFLTTRKNTEIGFNQDSQIRNLRQLLLRAAFAGCPHAPDVALAFIFSARTTPHDAACLLLWIKEKGYINDKDIMQLLK